MLNNQVQVSSCTKTKHVVYDGFIDNFTYDPRTRGISDLVVSNKKEEQTLTIRDRVLSTK